jgi:hypothetical protein
MPYKCDFTDYNGKGREEEFYRRYYLSASYIMSMAGRLSRHPGEAARSVREFLSYVFTSRRNPQRRDLY